MLHLEPLEERALPSSVTPTNVKAKVLSSSEVELTWTPASNSTGYEVALESNGSWDQIGGESGGKSNHIYVTGLSPGDSYEFDVASNFENIALYYAPPVGATTLPDAPAAPNFDLQANSQSQVAILWNSVSEATSYKVVEEVGNGWTTVATLNDSYTGFTLSGLKAGHIYTFDVIAGNAGGWTWGSAQSIMTYPAAPALSVKALSPSEALLTWKSVPGATGYYVDEFFNGAWTYLGSVSIAGCTVSELTAGVTYGFDVAAVDAGGLTWSAAKTVLMPTMPTSLIDSPSPTWSGYAIDPGSDVFAVGGTWVVPTFSSSGLSAAGIWVGIDGFQNSTVEQLGIGWNPVNGYYSWIEFFGDESASGQQGPFYAPYMIGVPVRPGDKISAYIAFVSSNGLTSTFFMSFYNVTENVLWQAEESTTYVLPQLATGEWIVESPGGGAYPLPAFTPVSFTGAWATVGNQTGSISNFYNYSLDLSTSLFQSGGGVDETSGIVNSGTPGYGEPSNAGSSSFGVFFMSSNTNGPSNASAVPTLVSALMPSSNLQLGVRTSTTGIAWQLLDSPKHKTWPVSGVD